MMRRLGVVVAILCIVVTSTLKANAEQATTGGSAQGQGVGEQLRQEIESLRKQGEQLCSKLQ